jgi:hypothetical protein
MARVDRCGFLLAGLFVLAKAADASGFQYGIDAGIGETDNVTLAPGNKVSQTIAVTDLDFSLKEAGSRLSENVTGNFSYLDFLQHEYGSELLGRFSGVGSYALIPDSLAWTVQDNWGQAQIDPFNSLTPTNLEHVNYFSTGPTWYARLGSTTFLNLSGLYSRADYQVTPINNSRLQGSVQLGHEISAQSSLTANAQVLRVLYKDTVVNNDYDLTRYYLRYELHGARTDASMDIGIDRENTAGNPSSGLLVRLDTNRRISQAVTLDLAAGRTLTDASSGFNTQQTGNATSVINPGNPVNVVTNAPALFTSSVYTGDYLVGGWRYQRSRTVLALVGRLERDRYLYEQQFNGTRDRVDLTFERKLTHLLDLQLYGNVARNHYDHNQFVSTAGGYSDLDGLYGFTLTLRQGRGLEFRLRGTHLARTVNSGAGVGYAENRIFLTVGYRPETGP